jgi:hypothetical protein
MLTDPLSSPLEPFFATNCWCQAFCSLERTIAAREHSGILAGEVGAGERQQRALAALVVRHEARRQRQHAWVHPLAARGAQHVQQAAAAHQGQLVKQLQLQPTHQKPSGSCFMDTMLNGHDAEQVSTVRVETT